MNSSQRHLVAATVTALLALPAAAALAPQYQNVKDLDVMVAFVRQHTRVAAGLRTIDLQANVIVYGDGCRAEFERQVVQHPPGWVGPQAPLVFVRASCEID